MTLPIYRDTFAKMQQFRRRKDPKPGLETGGGIAIPKTAGFKEGDRIFVRVYEPSTGKLWESEGTCKAPKSFNALRVYVSKENRPDYTALCVVALDRPDGDRIPIMEVGVGDRVTCGKAYPLAKTSRLVLSKAQSEEWKNIGVGAKVECAVHEVGSDTVYRFDDRRVSYCNIQNLKDGSVQCSYCIFLPKNLGLSGKRCLAVYHVCSVRDDDS